MLVPRLATAAVVLGFAVAGCGGSTTTKTVTKVATAAPTSATSSTTPVATSTTAPVTPSSSSTTSPVVSATSASTAPVFFQGAAGGRVQHPSSLQLTADGTLAVADVQWTSWGGSTASGTGNASYHGCNPNCASAPTHTAVVSIHLGDPRVCSGRRYYSSVALTLNSGRLLDESFLQQRWSPC